MWLSLSLYDPVFIYDAHYIMISREWEIKNAFRDEIIGKNFI